MGVMMVYKQEMNLPDSAVDVVGLEISIDG